ncbi:hypothetical protein EV126DRAFT_424107 [Verticillium dahliae]|nr:hypothetical protein EV126DRAFT_424107 [Verticillium dahliae]
MEQSDVLVWFQSEGVDEDIIAHVAALASTVTYSDTTGPDATVAACAEDPDLPSLTDFITELVERLQLTPLELMASRVYLGLFIDKLSEFGIKRRGRRCTNHLVILSCLMVANKCQRDHAFDNQVWTTVSQIYEGDRQILGFQKHEVNMGEKNLLALLDWKVDIEPVRLTEEVQFYLAMSDFSQMK